jgi:hypothetical protein
MTMKSAGGRSPARSSENEDYRRVGERATSCPAGNAQRAVRCLSYREREPLRLQVRVAIRPSIEGVCDAFAEEDEDERTVRVRVFLCHPKGEAEGPDREYLDCPVHVYLDKPLGGRKVIDALTGKPLSVFVPDWE